MLESEKLAIAAHLHVLLRRKVGRVTDVEWMVKNNAYALEVVRITRAEPHAELHEWADKLEGAVQSRRTPLVLPLPPAPPSPSVTALNALGAVLRASRPKPAPAVDSQFDGSHGDSRYVGRLR